MRACLIQLPEEILEMIVSRSLPEGFESLLFACHKFYGIGAPFIERYNQLRSRFRDFQYCMWPPQPEKPGLEVFLNSFITTLTAFDLLTCIALDPPAARYIRRADFSADSRHGSRWRLEFIADNYMDFNPHVGTAILSLLQKSPHLASANIDPNEYYEAIREDALSHRYSQRAAAFILTLLPNVEELTLPRQWAPDDMTNRLLEAITDQKVSSNTSNSLGRLASLESLGFTGEWARFELESVQPFFNLPRLRSFVCQSLVVQNRPDAGFPSRRLGNFLQDMQLEHCCIDHIAMEHILKCLPNLKSLTYSHESKRTLEDVHFTIDYLREKWDIGKFVHAIQQAAGARLQKLSIKFEGEPPEIVPGTATFSNFKCLIQLEFPLELVLSIFAGVRLAQDDGEHGQGSKECSLTRILPSTISWLALVSEGSLGHLRALSLLFQDLTNVSIRARLPALQTIYLDCPSQIADSLYEKDCASLLDRLQGDNLSIIVDKWPNSGRVNWDSLNDEHDHD